MEAEQVIQVAYNKSFIIRKALTIRILNYPDTVLTLLIPFGIINAMKAELSIDKAGRIVLPQAVRRQFHLVAGDSLDLQILPDGIFLKTHPQQAHLTEINGLLVHDGEPTGDLIQAVEQSRSGRDSEVLEWRQ